MAADVLTLDRATHGLFSLDIHKSNAYAEDVKFDLNPPRRTPVFSPRSIPDFEPVKEIRVNPDVSMEHSPSKEWDVDVKGLISTRKWLQSYGLRKNRLDMHQILPQIGFKHSDDYDKIAKKPICSRYGNNLFQKYFRSDGQTYNISCSKDQLRQIEARLTQAICLYKRRLEWLTSESRRIFGVMEEKSVAVIVDIKNLSPQQFEQYRAALQRIIKEQLAHIAKFNLIRASEDLDSYKSHCVPVTGESLEGALHWVSRLDRCAAVSPTATCEAIMKAASDKNLEAVYLFTEGSACDGARELLKEKLTGSRLPVHVISYNCTDPETIRFLKDMARITGGKFHAYAVTMEMDSYEGLPVDGDTNQANIILKKKTYGGVPPGVGMREDVILLFEELEESRNNLAQIQGLLTDMPEKACGGADNGPGETVENINETYMSSREWLNRHGLKPKKLGFYDILAGVAFKHQDGVVNLKKAPRNDEYQTDAVTKQKLVNAKYCDKFPHVRWKDGQVVHVQVTPEIHRAYEQRMMLTMEAMQQRIDWLQQGSRELFGTVIEDQIYILIDTSASMAPHIQFLKDKLFVLMQEQLRHKQKFNLVAFNSRSHSWKDSLIEVNEKNLQSAWQWIKSLVCLGSTNTLASLRHALSDPSTQAIYLLTDGRPDQPPKSILAQVMLHPQVPVHTISFNCADKEANEFLCQLARETGGRYHYYNEDGLELDGPEPWESEDIRLLKQEMEVGYRNLEKVATLRDECAQLAWKKDDGRYKKCTRDHLLPDRGRDVAQPPLDPRELYRQDSRPNSAPSLRYQPQPPGSHPRPSTAHGYRPTNSKTGPSYSTRSMFAVSPRSRSHPSRPISARSYRPLTAGHTRTSILRSLSSNGSYGRPLWLLPETKELFDKQWDRQNQANEGMGPQKKKKKGKKFRKKQDSLEKMSSKRWLSQHGLAVMKLTLVDALAPTFIPHKRRYIPILDKHVESKVFDDIMPMGHVTGDKMNIINPQAVKLGDYIKKVSATVDKYNNRLNMLVWDALPKEVREEYESAQPVSFLDNRYKLMQALDQSGWPVSERDITLLENEIKKGNAYIKQAKDLKQAAKCDGEGLEQQEVENYDNAASAVAREKDFENVTGGTIASKTGDKTKTSKIMKHHKKLTLDSLRGQKVIGRSDVDGFYYPGIVIKCPDSRHALVEYNDIGQKRVPTRFVIPTSGAISRPPIRMGDYVLARVVNQDTGLECYVPGVVHITPKRYEDQAKFYTVTLYTTQEAHFLRGYLIKISKMRYDFLAKFIEELNKNKQDDDDRAHNNRSQSRTHSRSRSRSSSYSRSEYSSDSRSSSRSGSSQYSRHSESTVTDVEEQKNKLKKWKKQLEKQQQDHDKKQKKLREKSKKLAKLKKQLHQGSHQTRSEHQKLLKLIVDEIDENQKSRSSGSSSSRTREWIGDHHKGSPNVELGPDGSILFHSDGNKGFRKADQESHVTSSLLLELRRSLPSLKDGEEVLARWSDEGWYYRGIIKEQLDNGAYLMEDSTEALEKIWREDIIADNDDADVTIQPMDPVVALHPSYSFSYAPGVVMEVTSELSSKVRFYDGEESLLPRVEVFRISRGKFEADVAYILQKEEQWVGAPVVARNEDTGLFQLGVIKERVGNGRQYVIEWSDSSQTVQSSLDVFGAFTKCHSLNTGDRVLAIADPKMLTYLPGWITAKNGDKLAVKFCDGSFSNQIDPYRSCFWLSQEYYDTAVHFYKSKN